MFELFLFPSSPGPPYALLFEFPLYGSLHSFLTCKKQGIASDNSSKWAGLEFRSLEPSVLSALPECNRKVLSPHLANYISRAGPFMAPLNKPLASLDMLLFALQVADAMEFLEKSRVREGGVAAGQTSDFFLQFKKILTSKAVATLLFWVRCFQTFVKP